MISYDFSMVKKFCSHTWYASHPHWLEAWEHTFCFSRIYKSARLQGMSARVPLISLFCSYFLFSLSFFLLQVTHLFANFSFLPFTCILLIRDFQYTRVFKFFICYYSLHPGRQKMEPVIEGCQSLVPSRLLTLAAQPMSIKSTTILYPQGTIAHLRLFWVC